MTEQYENDMCICNEWGSSWCDYPGEHDEPLLVDVLSSADEETP